LGVAADAGNKRTEKKATKDRDTNSESIPFKAAEKNLCGRRDVLY